MLGKDALAVLAVRDYRLYWSGNVLSKVGTEMQHVALAWQIYALTGQPLSLGLVGLLRAGPALVLPIVGGAAGDAMSRRALLLGLGALQVALSTALATLTYYGAATLAVLYGFVFLTACVSSLEGPVRGTVTPTLVPRELLVPAVALNNLLWSTAATGGPALGGLVLGAFGATVVYALDAASFGFMIAGLLAVRTPLLTPDVAPEDRGPRGQLRRIGQGFDFVRTQPVLLGLMALDFAAVLLGASHVLLPAFAKDVFAVGPEGLGLLAAAPAAGAVIGAALMALLPYPQRAGVWVLWAIAGYGVCVTGFGLAPGFWLAWACLAGTGVADTISMTLRQSIRLLVTPDPMRARVGGINYVFAVSGTQLGEFEAGVAAQWLGVRAATAAGGLACVALVALCAWRFPAIGRFGTPTDEPTEQPRQV